MKTQKTGLANTTLTSMLDRMQNSGLVERVYDKSDRRKILVALTKKARSLEKDYNDVSTKTSKIFYKGFSENEISKLEEYLERI